MKKTNRPINKIKLHTNHLLKIQQSYPQCGFHICYPKEGQSARVAATNPFLQLHLLHCSFLESKLSEELQLQEVLSANLRPAQIQDLLNRPELKSTKHRMQMARSSLGSI